MRGLLATLALLLLPGLVQAGSLVTQATSEAFDLESGDLLYKYGSSTDQCFRLDLANWFLRVLVAPIELGYDPDSRHLIRYRGLSNIGDANGNGLVVDLQYNYRDVPRSACAVLQAEIANSPATIPHGRLAKSN